MNRLILIGNGFDLAHKMKTSYYDFVFHYIQTCFLKAKQNNSYQDDLISINRNHSIAPPVIEAFKEVKEFMPFLISKAGLILSAFDGEDIYRDMRDANAFSWEIKSDFIERLFTECHHCGWVDIENEYYTALKKILEGNCI